MKSTIKTSISALCYFLMPVESCGSLENTDPEFMGVRQPSMIDEGSYKTPPHAPLETKDLISPPRLHIKRVESKTIENPHENRFLRNVTPAPQPRKNSDIPMFDSVDSQILSEK